MPIVDFVAAKLQHTLWKMKLRRYLDGEETLTLAQATDHHACEVGRWLDAPTTGGLAVWGHLTEMRELDAAHKALHAAVKQVIECHDARRTAEAEAHFAEAEEHSQRVVALLDLLQTVTSKRVA